MINRRRFIRHAAFASAGVAMLPSLPSFGEPVVEQPFLSFDLHTHPGAFFAKGSPTYPGDGGALKTVSGMNEGKLTGAFFSLVADAPLLEVTATGIKTKGSYAPGDASREYQRQIGLLKEMLKTVPASLALKTADLDRAYQEGKVAAFLACEGGEFLEGNAEVVDQLYADGIRSIQLVHYAVNVLGDLQTAAPQHQGLSAAGKAVVKKMNSLGMVVDVAHASYETVKDVIDVATAPIILSHSILKMEDSRPIAARAISVEHAKLVAKTGGVIGAWPSGFNNSFEEFVDNTVRLVEVAGVDHVGLGTDMDGNFKPVFSSYVQLPQWAAALQAKGLSKADVAKVMGGNMKRVLTKVVG
ncbi:MAG: membrane dipeptidase [Cyclobacteriaceae bacterium]|nr:membrane dipeptidase [Cyclobacteriaceae bacterium]